jgi:YHS domain-containing protein
MDVDPATAQWTFDYKGERYYFCAPGCKASFEQDPEKFLGGGGSNSHHEGHNHKHGHKHGHMWPFGKKK